MRYVDLPVGDQSSGAKVSVLGFGCAALMGRAGRSESIQALNAVLDAGINFFDTARSYGYGESESLLGEYFAGRRHEVVLCTKFGIVPGPRGGWKQRIKPLAQAAIRLFPSLRSIAQRQAAGQLVAGQFSVEVLTASFEESLRSLRTDYVDMLLLHAAPMSVLQKDELFDALQRLVESGKVRMAGISGEHDVIAATFRNRPSVLTTAQFALNRTNLSFIRETIQPSAQEMFLVGNHPFGGPVGVASTMERIAAMRTAEDLPAAMREKLTPGDPQLMPEILLNAVLQDTGVSAVVPAMMRTENIRRNVRAVEDCRFTASEIALLREELIRNP